MRNFQIAGRIGIDLELNTKGDTSWTRFSVATNNGANTRWFWVTAFGKLAVAMVDHLAKGDGVAISGELSLSRYGGQERIELIASWADFFRNR